MLDVENNGAGGHELERAVGERNAVGAGRVAPVGVPDPELVEGPKRPSISPIWSVAVLTDDGATDGAMVRF
jgi:hypothetical protein